MADPGPPGSPEELEERWKEAIQALGERPRDADLLVRAAQLSEELQRPLEAYTYYHKALNLDPSKSFLVANLRALAATPQQKEEVAKVARRPVSFEAALGDIFKYPLRGKGLPVLILGALFLWFARGLFRFGSGGMYGLSLGGLAGAYMAMFYVDVCHTTIAGEDHLPDWPDILRINEFVTDVAKFFMAGVAAFLPVIALFLIFGSGSTPDEEDPAGFRAESLTTAAPAVGEEDDDAPAPAATPPAPARKSPPQASMLLPVIGMAVFGLLGLLYLPMATLANIVMGSPWACLNFPFVLRSLVATPRNYLICLAAYFGTALLVGFAETGARIGGVVLLTGFALAFLELYGMTVLMRLLGHFYRMNQAKLGWLTD